MKGRILLAAACIAVMSVNAFAANVGTYVGVKAGWDKFASDSYSNGDASFKASDSAGLAWGLQTGVNFSPYWGVELGYDRFSRLKYNDQAGTVQGTAYFSAYDLSVLAKAYLPLPNNIDLMAGLGVAYVKGDYTGDVGDLGVRKPNWWRPKAALGVDYRFNEASSLVFSVERIFGTGSLNQLAEENKGSGYLPSINQASLAFNYSFGA